MPKHLLAALQATELAALSGGTAQWVQLLPAEAAQGKSWRGKDGRGPYRVADAKALLAASGSPVDGDQAAVVADIALDYDHAMDNPASAGTVKPASGWIKRIELRSDGIWGRVEWTGRAAEAIAAREYRFFSPAFTVDEKTGGLVRLVGGGLTNRPNFDLAALAASQDLTHKETLPMTPEQLAALRAALNLTAETDAAAIVTAAQTMAKQLKDHASAIVLVGGTLGLAAGTSPAEVARGVAERLDAKNVVSVAEFKKVEGELNTLRAAMADRDATGAVETAMREGKIAPAQKEWALAYAKSDKDGFANFVAASPAIVQPGSQGAQLAQRGGRDAVTGFAVAQGDAVDAERLALHNKVLAHQRQHPTLSYEQALAAVSAQ